MKQYVCDNCESVIDDEENVTEVHTQNPPPATQPGTTVVEKSTETWHFCASCLPADADAETFLNRIFA